MMKIKSVTKGWVLIFALLGLAACGDDRETTSTEPLADNAREEAEEVCASCGTIAAISEVEGNASGAGMLIGAIVGGLAGNQVGEGSGQDAATVAGAVGGAAIGNRIEEERRRLYQITINMEDGTQRVITVPNADGIRVGTDVRVEGNNISLR